MTSFIKKPLFFIRFDLAVVRGLLILNLKVISPGGKHQTAGRLAPTG